MTNPIGWSANPTGSTSFARIVIGSDRTAENGARFRAVTVTHSAVVARNTRARLAAIVVRTAAAKARNARQWLRAIDATAAPK